MDVSNPQKRSKSRGWWPVAAGILLVFSGTLGLGFYLPLRQSHGLLEAEFAAKRSAADALQASLDSTKAALGDLNAKREALEHFKDKTETAQQLFPKLANRLETAATSTLQNAFARKHVDAVALDDGVALSWMNPALLNWKRTAPSKSGQSILCPSFTQASALGLSRVTVHTFTPTDAWSSDVGEAHAKAMELSLALAEFMVRFCKVKPSDLTVASSLATDGAPLLQIQFRPGSSEGQLGL